MNEDTRVVAARRQVLFIGLCPPCPMTNGQRIRNHNLLYTLKQEGFGVFLLAFAEPNELAKPDEALRSLCTNVELIPIPKRVSRTREYFSRILNLLEGAPYGPRRFRSKSMTTAIQRVVRQHPFEAIICDDVYIATNLPKNLLSTLLLNKHDLTYEIMARYLEKENSFLKRMYVSLESRKVRRLELMHCNKARAVLACSTRDKSLIESQCPESKVFVLPNVIDADKYTPEANTDGNMVLFVGSLDWLPNRDAAEYFAEQVFPFLKRSHPNARFVVAGRFPPPEFRESIVRIPGVDLIANVPDIRDLLARATVCVVPLRIGSGTRLKILEAGAMCKPVVSTRIGAEGLDFVEGKEIILEDDPERFACAVSELLRDTERRKSMGQAARDRVCRQYGLPALRDAVRTAFTDNSVNEGANRSINLCPSEKEFVHEADVLAERH